MTVICSDTILRKDIMRVFRELYTQREIGNYVQFIHIHAYIKKMWKKLSFVNLYSKINKNLYSTQFMLFFWPVVHKGISIDEKG